ncbi:MAG: ATP-binding cassette domain-containing protein [Prevotella sp.]|jgi:ABC-2 type transport system ATP-binding protein|nr:ATP-binding cassette domain-containing protein [Prevotella sp.]
MYYLEAQDVVKQYGNHTALNGVSMQVPKGCIYGLLGPNGAGKSSLIRIINRITAPDEGKVFLNGRESTADDVFNIGYLPEERGLYKKMKVGEHIIFLAKLRGLSKEEAIQKTRYWLKKFDILSWEDKKVEELSKGMQQKIQFIATVIHEPDLYILDEPFSGFDPVNTELLKTELLELKAKGKTIILSTHNMESVEELCDEISLINKSKVVLNGNVKEIRSRYRKHIFKLQVAGDSFDMESELYSILSQSVYKDYTEVRIQRVDDEASNSALIQEVAEKYEIISFEEELPSMNDIFIQIVSQKEQ